MKEKEVKAKKPIYKKWWFWLIIVVIVFGGFGGSSSKDKTADEKPKAEVATEKQEEAQELTDEQKLEIINLSAETAGYKVRFELKDNDFLAQYVTDEDMQNAILLGLTDNEEIKEAVEEYKKAFIATANANDNIFGRPMKSALVNPANEENYLLIVENGKITYDAFEE